MNEHEMNEFERLRLLAGKSISTAAAEIGVSPSTVYCWENKNYSPAPSRFGTIAKCYGCSMEAVVNAYAAQN